MTRTQALAVIQMALATSLSKASSMVEQDMALVAVEALEEVRGAWPNQGGSAWWLPVMDKPVSL